SSPAGYARAFGRGDEPRKHLSRHRLDRADRYQRIASARCSPAILSVRLPVTPLRLLQRAVATFISYLKTSSNCGSSQPVQLPKTGWDILSARRQSRLAD